MPDTADPTQADRPSRPDRSPTGTPTGRQRLLAALKRPARAQVVVAILLAAVGFSAVTQVRANEVDNTYAGYREQDLIDVLNGLAGTTQRAESEIARLEATRDEPAVEHRPSARPPSPRRRTARHPQRSWRGWCP